MVALSNDLASQFAKLLNDGNDKKQKETSMYGTFIESGKKKYVKLDGSELLTPVIQTAAAKGGERVTVTVKNRTAVVTGNLSSPAARSGDVEDLSAKVLSVEELMAKKVSTDEFEATIGRIGTLETDNATIRDTLTAQSAKIDDLEADNATINGTLTAQSAKIDNLETTKLSAEIAEITYATITNLDATNVAIRNLDADYGKFKDATVESFRATEADIESLNTTKLSAEQADIRYANIDFSNIGKAAIEQFYATSGIIKDLVIGDQTVTGELVGVTIKGDLIEGNTIKADKLVVKGSDGLYYKLNVSAETVETEQTDQNSLNGNIITAKSITATKISVEDLVAFDATIGGFNITNNAIYSGVKSSVNNTTRGIYQDKDGQIAFGDGDSFLKYFKDKDGNYKLAISADNIKFSASNKDLDTVLGSTITSAIEEFYLSESPTSLSGGSWSKTQPTWTEGKYIWRRTAVTYGDGSSEHTPSPNGVCITGNTGAKGDTGEKGDTGAAGKGIKSTAVTYQAGASATTAPTGTWQSSPQTTSASLPYMWTKTVITYTDDTTSTSYSVGSTPDGIQVGGRNLLHQYIRAGQHTSKINDKSIKIGTAVGDAFFWLKPHVALVKGETYTISCDASNVPSGCNWSFGVVNQTSKFQLYINKNGRCSATGILEKDVGADSEILFDDRFNRPSTAPNIILSNFKLEKGNKATDWTPAPEDVDAQIQTVRTQITDAQTEISSTKESIKLLATKTEVTAVSNNLSALTKTVSNYGTAIDQNAKAISIRATKDEVTKALNGKVSTGEVVSHVNSELKVSGNRIDLTTGHFTIDSDNIKVSEAGDVEITGKIIATSGKFTGEITSSKATITGGSVNITSDGSYSAYMTITATNVPTGYGEKIGTVTTNIDAGGMKITSGNFSSHYGGFGLDVTEGTTTYFSTGSDRTYALVLETLEAHVTGNLTVSGTINGIRWNWSGQGGQPSWLWGGNDGANMYVYNPSNFSVNHANSANYANSAGGISAPIYGYDKNVNITCGGWSTPASVTLPAGTYVGIVFAKMYGTPASRMVMVFSTNSGATDAGAYMSDDNMDRACCSSPVVINVSGNTNFYLRVYNSMSGVRACHCGWYLVKVK